MFEPVSATALFRWPETAAVGRIIPKERLYAEAGASKFLRQQFIDEIQGVSWAYKLSEESLHLVAGDDVAEIQVFEVELKGTDVSESVLTSIDKSVPSAIICELRRTLATREEVQLVGAQKGIGARGVKLSSYFRSEWVSSDSPRTPLPPALELAALYSQLLITLMPIPARLGESLSGTIDRVARVRKLEREISALDNRMRVEPQFNRKVQLRKDLLSRQGELDDLLSPEPKQNRQTDC